MPTLRTRYQELERWSPVLAREIPRTPLLRAATWLIGWILVAEIIVIEVQAARGTTSHFNIDTPLNITLFSAMGTGIATVWVMSRSICSSDAGKSWMRANVASIICS